MAPLGVPGPRLDDLPLDDHRSARGARPPATRVSLVWTGPETRSSVARDTAVVVRELFEGATWHVLVAGYSFERGEAILAPPHAAMRDRGVKVEMFVHLPEAAEGPVDPEWYMRTHAGGGVAVGRVAVR